MTEGRISLDAWRRRYGVPVIFRDDGGWTADSRFLIRAGSPEEATASGFGAAREGETYAKLVRRQSPPQVLGFIVKTSFVPALNAASDTQLEELWRHLVGLGAKVAVAT
jgi:hypothetical protein